MADLATGSEWEPAHQPSGTPIPEIAGPRKENLLDAATLLIARRGDRLRAEGVTDLTDPDHDLYESGALLPGPGATLGGPTFVEWLDATGAAAQAAQAAAS